VTSFTTIAGDHPQTAWPPPTPRTPLVGRKPACRPELGELWSQVLDRRARDMRALTADLAATGELCAGLTLDKRAQTGRSAFRSAKGWEQV
jgi:hypothetical protein